ncbi:MAG: hypothetical protein FWD40_03655 [Treponema sp.]|nr:hypothetical protein [Treponema sp.]
MKKGAVLVFIFGLFLNYNIGASMVSFYVVEAGLSNGIESVRHAEIWEDAFMDVFFDAGHIVSNAPILRLDTKPKGDILQAVAFDIIDDRGGGIEYVLIAMLDYSGNLPSPGEISFYIYRLVPRQKILERIIPGKSYRTAREELDDIRSIVRGLVPYIGD